MNDTQSKQTLFPIFHSCGAIALYSKVPVHSGHRVPHWTNLLLADGRTPMWTSARGMLIGRDHPAAPDCPSCGETTNRALRTSPGLN